MGLDEGLDGYPERPLKVKIEKRYERALKTRAVDDIIAFLKEWNRRVKINPGKLRRAILDTSLILEKLRGFNIVSVDLSSSINIGGQVKTLRDIILELFRTFSRVSEGRANYTGASKILHVLAPTFFVMWDDTIRCAYGCRLKNGDADEKYFKFLVRVQKVARQAVDSYCDEHGCEVNRAVRKIREQFYENGFHTFSRIIDIYNFVKFTAGRDELW